MSKEACEERARYAAAIEAFNLFPKDVRLMLHEDMHTAFINRVKAMKRILRHE